MFSLGCNEAFALDSGFSDPKDIIGKDDYQWRGVIQRNRIVMMTSQVIKEGGIQKLNIEEQHTIASGKTITVLTPSSFTKPSGES